MDATTARLTRTSRGVAAALVAATLVVATAGVARSAEPVGEGASQLSINPAALDLDMPVGDEIGAALGHLVLEATNVGVPSARLAFEGLGAGGQGAAPLALSSADGDKHGSEEVGAAAAGFAALVGLVDYAVEAGDDHAAARLGALSGSLETPLGLGAQLDAQRVGSTVTSTGAASELALTVSGLELGLGDLLPADVLAGLPLGVVLEIVEGLGVTVPADLAGLITDVEQLVPVLEGAVAAVADLEAAEAELDAVIAGDPTLAALQGAVDDAEQAVTAAETAVASAEAGVATIEQAIAALEAELLDPNTSAARLLAIPGEILALEADLATAEQLVAGAQTALAQARQDLAGAVAALAAAVDGVAAVLAAEIERLQQLVDDLLAELSGLLTGLDLVELRLDLLDLVLSTPLLDLGALTLDLGTEAGPTSSLGEVTCTVGETRVLGTVVPTPDCAALGTALGQVGDAVSAALASLPITVPIPAVTASGPTFGASGAGVPDATGVTTASATVSPLHVSVPSVDLTTMVDGLVAELEALVADLLGNTGSLTAAQVNAEAVALPAGLDALVAELVASLDALPLGDTLDGLRTNGLDATVATIGLTSTFAAQQGGAPIDGGTPTGGPGEGSSDGSARSGPGFTPSGNLPRTGLDVGTGLAAAVAALAAGGVAMALRRELAA